MAKKRKYKKRKPLPGTGGSLARGGGSLRKGLKKSGSLKKKKKR